MEGKRGGPPHLSVGAKPVPDPVLTRSEPVRLSGTGPEPFQSGSTLKTHDR